MAVLTRRQRFVLVSIVFSHCLSNLFITFALCLTLRTALSRAEAATAAASSGKTGSKRKRGRRRIEVSEREVKRPRKQSKTKMEPKVKRETKPKMKREMRSKAKPKNTKTKSKKEPATRTARKTKGTEKKKKKRKIKRAVSGVDWDAIKSDARLQRRSDDIGKILDRLYPDPPIPLNFINNFTMLVAVMLSAQTTDGKVNYVTDTLFQRAPDPETMAKMKYEDLLLIVRSVGLAPTKTRNLLKMSQMILDRFGGRVPSTFEELEELPGVGHKTASVVMSQCFGFSSFAVDTHIHRLARRWGLAKPNANVKQVEAILKYLNPQSTWSKRHLQMIYFGREWCQAKKHVPADCPVCCWASPNSNAKPISMSVLRAMRPPPKASKQIILYSERVRTAKGKALKR